MADLSWCVEPDDESGDREWLQWVKRVEFGDLELRERDPNTETDLEETGVSCPRLLCCQLQYSSAVPLFVSNASQTSLDGQQQELVADERKQSAAASFQHGVSESDFIQVVAALNELLRRNTRTLRWLSWGSLTVLVVCLCLVSALLSDQGALLTAFIISVLVLVELMLLYRCSTRLKRRHWRVVTLYLRDVNERWWQLRGVHASSGLRWSVESRTAGVHQKLVIRLILDSADRRASVEVDGEEDGDMATVRGERRGERRDRGDFEPVPDLLFDLPLVSQPQRQQRLATTAAVPVELDVQRP